jgi:catechol 2,3-dioxygenase
VVGRGGDPKSQAPFYCGVIGFEPQANLGTAAFASAGGYHHHLGFNVWNGRGVGPAPEHSVGSAIGRSRCRPTRSRSCAPRRGGGHRRRALRDGFVVRDPWRIATAFVALPEAG